MTYDKSSSELGAANVQDAVDELAARPLAEPPLESRLERVFQQVDNPGTEVINVKQTCPQPTDIALGGGCEQLFGATLTGTSLGADAYHCRYEQPAGNTEKPFISVMCLHKAQ